MNDFIFDTDTHRISDGLQSITLDSARDTTGIGFVVLNTGQDRSEYIANCYRTNTVIIVTKRGDIIRNCIVPPAKWNDIVFPADNNSKGSLICWMNIQQTQTMILLDVLENKNEYSAKVEQGFVKERKTPTGSVHTSADGQAGIYNLFVESDGAGNAVINVRAINSLIKATIDFYVQGLFNVDAEGDIQLKSQTRFYTNVVDDNNPTTTNNEIEFTNALGLSVRNNSNNIVNATSSKTTLYTGSDVAVLGNKLIAVMKDLLKAINKITVMTPNGPSSTPLNSTDFSAIQIELNNFLSKKLLID